MLEVQGTEEVTEPTRGNDAIEVADEQVFQRVSEADVDALSFQNHLPLDVDDDQDDGKSKKAEGCVERVNGGEHRKDFAKVESPEDIDEKDNADDGE